MQSFQGSKSSLPLHDLSPLERAINDFEQKAVAYHRKAAAHLDNESPEQRLQREQELREALGHLNHERRHISIMAQIQIRLQEYQAKGRNMTVRDMLLEAHHPTGPLASYMRAAGRPQPSNRHSPHHVVQGKGRTPQSADVRLLMHMCGIRINDPDNGVWLPKTKADKGHWSMPKAPAHAEIHTHNYETWVTALTRGMETERTFRAQLVRIRTILRDGRQPAKVTSKPDASWSGK